MPIQLDDYRLLGRSGLRVFPLSLGEMTFGVGAGAWAAPTRSWNIVGGQDTWLQGSHAKAVALQRPYDLAKITVRRPVSPTRRPERPRQQTGSVRAHALSSRDFLGIRMFNLIMRMFDWNDSTGTMAASPASQEIEGDRVAECLELAQLEPVRSTNDRCRRNLIFPVAAPTSRNVQSSFARPRRQVEH